MATVTELDIAKLLRNDVRLVYEWEFFYHSLNLELNDTPAIERSWNSSRSSYSLMRNLIGQFVSEKGSNATIEALAKVLEACQHNYIKDVLLERFSPTARIVPFDKDSLEGATGQNADTMPEDTEEDRQLQQKTSGSVTILQLVDTKQAGKGRLLVCINHLLHMLSLIGNRPVAIISINGKQRSGKSFLANQFVRYLKYSEKGDNWLDKTLNSDFEWRGDLQRVTSGIQIWHEPLYVNVGGKEIAVIIMDTQGLHDQKTGAQENAIIFGMSVLLSSVFIFNEKNVADDSLQYLRSFLEFAKFATGGSVSEDCLTFQKLILLMRDFQADGFTFGYYDDSNCPPNQVTNLKNKIFELTSDMHPEAIETRSAIQACFEKVGVYAMSSPGKQLPNKFKESRNWDPDFVYSIIDFVTTFFNPEAIKNSTRRVFGQEITGNQLKEYATKWAQLIQEAEGVIQSKTIFESTAELFYTNKIEQSLREYRTTMNNHLECNPAGLVASDLNEFHDILVNSIVAGFSSGKVLGGPSMLDKYKKKLLQSLNGVKDDFFSVNDANVAAEQQRILREKELIEAQQREAELQRQQQETKQLAIANAESGHKRALHELGTAQGRVQQVMANRHNYKRPVEKNKKHRLFGIIHTDTTYYTDWVYDHGQYLQALQAAEADVHRLQQVVNEAEYQLNVTRNS
ncbi:unnamed protein product [Orchesella dallaii]|uniref:GB1/RHD3-type G domain-containing protein n=1 Tax=Orchesella dallaii TaxID=48710 RepID=A0ABP1R7T0_9HEXA